MTVFIRESYFGGATFYYTLTLKAKNLRYYDVNSLYPFAMKKAMPLELIRKFTNKQLEKRFNLTNLLVNHKISGDLKLKLLVLKQLNATNRAAVF